ncbi:MAG: hypothetical protein H0X65_06200 [Gemmatimonadetes bacterium]|jgi:hypothetical protein|nr:hypothetical protein [Gemmatimonadota bacterium]
MRVKNVVCVDLGSGYTKVALRKDWDHESCLVRDVPLAPREASFCIPSVVARVEDGGETRWVIGTAAAEQKPGKEVKIFRYWKARIFSDAPDAQNAKDAMGTADESSGAEYRQAGVVFFRELRVTLERMGIPVTLPIRVCIPKLDSDTHGQCRIREMITEAGWQQTPVRATVFEPESNACGILTRGRNATWFPPVINFMPSPGRSLSLGRMIEKGGLFRAFAQLKGSYGVLVVDIGAFTTDFGYVEFDTSFHTNDDWKRPRIVQQSRELGVRELDHAIFERLRPESREAVRRMSSKDWETFKVRLYAGGAFARRNPRGGPPIIIGEGDEARAISEAIREFAGRVVEAKEEFCREYVRGTIHAETLTGGGAMIPAVRAAVRRACPEDSYLYDLQDPAEPAQFTANGNGVLPPTLIERRLVQNLELVRGGSAIGGCSVLFS